MGGLPLASSTADAVPLGSGSRAPYVSPVRETWRRFRRHWLAVVGLAVLALMMLAVVLGPLVWRGSAKQLPLQPPPPRPPLPTSSLTPPPPRAAVSTPLSLRGPCPRCRAARRR